MPDISPYGSQTVTGPGWPNVDEEMLSAAAASYEALATRITGSVVPRQQSQLMQLSDTWEGAGSLAATGEASTIIGGHDANAAHAAAIAAKIRTMEAAVVRTKTLVNVTAQETQHECEAIQAMPFSNTGELIQSRIKFGLSQNIAYVNANATEMAGGLGVPPSIPTAGVPPVAAGEQAAKAAEDAKDIEKAAASGQDAQQAAQMMGQLAGMAAQLPQLLGQLAGQGAQQLTQPVQQLSQPLQQLTSMFGQGAQSGAGGFGRAGGLGYSAFSNHPLAGGSGMGGGAGMVKAASLPGAGGTPALTPPMATLLGTKPVATAPPEGALAGANAAGVAPVIAGGPMGGMGMMGTRGTSGGTTAGLAAPDALEYDLAEDDVDDW